MQSRTDQGLGRYEVREQLMKVITYIPAAGSRQVGASLSTMSLSRQNAQAIIESLQMKIGQLTEENAMLHRQLQSHQSSTNAVLLSAAQSLVQKDLEICQQKVEIAYLRSSLFATQIPTQAITIQTANTVQDIDSESRVPSPFELGR